MIKIIHALFKGKFTNSLSPSLQPISSKGSCYCVILIAIFQLLSQNADAIEIKSEQTNAYFQKIKVPLVQEDVREIKSEETVEGSIKVGESHSYKIKLEAGESIIVEVIRNSWVMTISSFTPDGELQSETRLREFSVMYEPLVIVAGKSGFYRINASAQGLPVTYVIKPKSSHNTTENDKKSLAALKLTHEIIEINKDESLTAEQLFQKQLKKTEEKLLIYEAIGDPKLMVTSLRDLGGIYGASGEFSNAIKYYTKALNLLSNVNDPSEKRRVTVESIQLNGALASASRSLGDFQKSLDYNYQALNLSRSIASKYLEALHLQSIGSLYYLLGDEQRALKFFEQSLTALGSVNLSLQAIILINIGNLHRGVSDGELALDYFSDKTAADQQKAIEYYKEALNLYKTSKNSYGQALVLRYIGNSYKELGNYSEALTYLENSLTFYKNQKDSANQFKVFRSIGNLYLRKAEFQKSIQYYEQALALIDKPGVRKAQSLNSIAKDYLLGGDTEKAFYLYNQALTISRENQEQDTLAVVLFELSRIERESGNFAYARRNVEEAIQIVESIRAKIAVQDARITYFATVKKYYDFYTDLLMQAHKSQPEKGFDLLALQISEKSKSRSLLDLLAIAKIDIKQGVESKLIEREKQVKDLLIEKAYQQNRLTLRGDTKEEAERIKAEVSNLTAEYEEIQAEIRNKSPRYAALTQPSSVNAKQIQQLLDSGTILLEYSLGEKKSYLWTVSADSIKSFDLPARDEIENQARIVYELLTARNLHLENETDQQRRDRITAAENEYPKAAEKLSRMLLGSISAELGNKRLLIVADGALNYLPFSALPEPKTDTAVNLWQPLGMSHEIVNLPSASVLSLLREENVNRKSAPKMLAVYADPVFSQTDVRLNTNLTISKNSDKVLDSNKKTENLSANHRDMEHAAKDVGLIAREAEGLPRLAFSRREAESIFNVSPKNLSLKAVDFRASKSELINSDVDQYRILHFASHGLLNSQHPELSGVVLSLVDQNGLNIDGFLRLHDIYNLKLSADLVVLSACNTALGKDVKGEGLIGLTRGFMYSGAARVVASLWKVDDAATAELMVIFYRKLLAENLRPAAALRASQTEMMKQTRYKSPYYWAPFIIQGEWK